jgi:hypothetical protein
MAPGYLDTEANEPFRAPETSPRLRHPSPFSKQKGGEGKIGLRAKTRSLPLGLSRAFLNGALAEIRDDAVCNKTTIFMPKRACVLFFPDFSILCLGEHGGSI